MSKTPEACHRCPNKCKDYACVTNTSKTRGRFCWVVMSLEVLFFLPRKCCFFSELQKTQFPAKPHILLAPFLMISEVQKTSHFVVEWTCDQYFQRPRL